MRTSTLRGQWQPNIIRAFYLAPLDIPELLAKPLLQVDAVRKRKNIWTVPTAGVLDFVWLSLRGKGTDVADASAGSCSWERRGSSRSPGI